MTFQEMDEMIDELKRMGWRLTGIEAPVPTRPTWICFAVNTYSKAEATIQGRTLEDFGADFGAFWESQAGKEGAA